MATPSTAAVAKPHLAVLPAKRRLLASPGGGGGGGGRSLLCVRRCRMAESDAGVPPTSAVAIECRNVSFSFPASRGMEEAVLRDCSLRVPPGQLWMLIGPNGCGKSTLLKILAGFLKPTHGTVYVSTPKNLVFQNPDHQVVMPTVEADVAFGLGKLELAAEDVRQRVSKALDSVGMLPYSQRPIQILSGGQKQRVAIAGALAVASKVLLLDELTTFLDEHDQASVTRAIRGAVGGTAGDVSALWVTHRREELEYADRFISMEGGRIIH